MGQENLSVRQYNDTIFTVSVIDADGQPVDLTNATIYFIVKSDLDDSDDEALISKTCNITNPAGGEFQIELSHSDYSFDAGVYPYVCRIVFQDGKVFDALFGEFKVQKTASNKTI